MTYKNSKCDHDVKFRYYLMPTYIMICFRIIQNVKVTINSFAQEINYIGIFFNEYLTLK